nr:Gfo/Idh/MocA family oxidoreductase [Gracilibacillus sp. YIM 98692]
MLRIGVIGLGDISTIHLSTIKRQENTQLVALCDIDESKQNMVKDIPFYTNYHEMLTEADLDCVHICLPHHLHYPVTKAAAENDIHVILEKPLAHNMDDSRALVKLEKDYPNVKIGVSLQNRLNETMEEIASIIASGTYGKVLGLKGLVTWRRPKSYYESKPWRGAMNTAGGGVMINQSIHTLDLLQLFGGEIKSIRGSVDRLLDYGLDIEDTATAHIHFQSGATGLFFATLSNAENDSVEFQVLLENARLTVKDSILTLTDQDGKKQVIIEDQKLPGSKFYYGASHAKLIDQFYQQIKQDGSNYIRVKDAHVSMEMIDLIYKSSEVKKKMKMGVLQ